MPNTTLDQVFTERTKDISSIFSSYRTLYEIYLSALKAVRANQNTVTAIENAKKSVEGRQAKISGQLYSQGFILLTGAAEALLKDLFDCLLRENFSVAHLPKAMNFSAAEIQDILNKESDLRKISDDLGATTVKKLASGKNPTEKINFQNVATTKQVLDQYFGLTLSDSDYSKHVHKHWQVRHALIHNAGVIDDRYMHNVKVVGLLTPPEKVKAKVRVTKQIFDDANEDFLKLFNEIDQLIEGTSLSCSLINHGAKDNEKLD
jgi:hypothetical protein